MRQAAVQLEAEAAPAGMMPVVLGPGWPGILLHEAVGHGLEGDFNRKGTSAFSGRVGQQVASSLCTIVDDGTLPNRRGSLAVDDEGTPGQYNVLVENGVLRGYEKVKRDLAFVDAAHHVADVLGREGLLQERLRRLVAAVRAGFRRSVRIALRIRFAREAPRELVAQVDLGA